MKHLEVVAAIIIVDQKILCVQRGVTRYAYTSNKYEFPGGKIEQGETPEQALRREIQEELQLDIRIDQHFLTVTHAYPDFTITLHCYLCTCSHPDLTLTEHVDAKWMERDLIATLDWVEADREVLEKIVFTTLSESV